MNNKYFIWKHVLNTLYEVRIKERSSTLLTFFLIIYVVNAHIRKVKSQKTIRLTSDYLRFCIVSCQLVSSLSIASTICVKLCIPYLVIPWVRFKVTHSAFHSLRWSVIEISLQNSSPIGQQFIYTQGLDKFQFWSNYHEARPNRISSL